MLRNDRLSVTTTPLTQVGWPTSRSIDALGLFSNNYTYVCTWRLRLTYQKGMATEDEHGYYGDVSLFWSFTSILICLIKGFPRSIKDFPRMTREFCLDSSIIKRTLLMAVAENLRMGPFCLNDLPSGERVLGSKQTQDPPTPWYHPGASSQSPSPLSRICILPLLPIWSSAANLPLWCIRDVSLCSKHSYRGSMVTLKINFILTHQYQGIFANLFHSTEFAFLAPKELYSHNGLKGIHCLYILLGKVRMLLE